MSLQENIKIISGYSIKKYCPDCGKEMNSRFISFSNNLTTHSSVLFFQCEEGHFFEERFPKKNTK